MVEKEKVTRVQLGWRRKARGKVQIHRCAGLCPPVSGSRAEFAMRTAPGAPRHSGTPQHEFASRMNEPTRSRSTRSILIPAAWNCATENRGTPYNCMSTLAMAASAKGSSCWSTKSANNSELVNLWWMAKLRTRPVYVTPFDLQAAARMPPPGVRSTTTLAFTSSRRTSFAWPGVPAGLCPRMGVPSLCFMMQQHYTIKTQL